jgi:FtsH-binding integral membrane protein
MQLQENVLSYSASTSYMAQVFFYFGLAIAMSAAGTFIGLNYLAAFFLANPFLMYVLFAAELILIFTSRLWSERRPINYLLFSAFAFITGITIVPLIALFMMEFQGVQIIIKALLATTAMFTATALFGWVTKWNLSGLRGFLMASLIGIIVVSILGIFIPWGNSFEMFFAGFGVILFSGYTMYDIQQIKSTPGLSPIDAALRLYLDIFNLFIFILRLMGAFTRD